MLLHLFIGDGQLVKPPEDLNAITMTISTGGGHGKGGRDYELSSTWKSGTFLRFHNTIVLGDVTEPKNKMIVFTIKGFYKDKPSKETILGTGK
jgi:hypothetical protein